jgi:AcrR family transcriptional regulator
VAREAGISAPSIYPHFADVQAIEDAVLERAFAELDEAVAAALEAQTTPAEALVAGCLAYVMYAWEHRPRYRFMVAGGGFAPDAVATFARIETALEACIASRASASTDRRGDAFLIWVGMHGMASLEKPDRPELRRLGPLDRVALTETLARTLAKLPLV